MLENLLRMLYAKEKRSFSIGIIGAGTLLLPSLEVRAPIIMTDDPCILCPIEEESVATKHLEVVALTKTRETLSLIFVIKESDLFSLVPLNKVPYDFGIYTPKIINKKILQSVPSISRGPPKVRCFIFLLHF